MLVFERQQASMPIFYYNATGVEEREMLDDFAQIWKAVFRHVRENREDGSWNRLIFEIWVDRSCIRIYPQMRGDSPNRKIPEVDISLNCLTEIQKQILDESVPTKSKSLRALGNAKISYAINNSYTREPALSELKRTLESNDFTCWLMKNDNTDSIMKIHLIF